MSAFEFVINYLNLFRISCFEFRVLYNDILPSLFVADDAAVRERYDAFTDRIHHVPIVRGEKDGGIELIDF